MPFYRGIFHEPGEPAQQSATSRAYFTLKEDILTCQLSPGAGIYEGEIAQSLQMSKTPVREALGMLAHEGFVEVRPRQGYRVTDITLADVQEIFHLRLMLEPAAAELAAERASADELQRLRQLVEEESGSYEEKVLRAGRFHTVLAEASGNARLSATLRNLLEEMQRLFFIGLDLKDSVEHQESEHRELLDALLKANHHLAAEIARRQVETSRMRVLEAILASLTGSKPATAADQVKLRPTDTDGRA